MSSRVGSRAQEVPLLEARRTALAFSICFMSVLLSQTAMMRRILLIVCIDAMPPGGGSGAARDDHECTRRGKRRQLPGASLWAKIQE